MEGVHIWPLLFPEQHQRTMKVHVPGTLDSAFAEDCGFQTLAWLTALLSGRPHKPMTRDMANQWRHLFWQLLTADPTCFSTRPLLLGGQSELETSIAAILREHGVFASRVAERSKQVINVLGATPLTQALRSIRPWVAIKELANQQTPKFRLIWEDEFDQVVKNRSTKDPSFAGKKKRQMPKQHTPYSSGVHSY